MFRQPRSGWRTSSFSNGNGGSNCVEVATDPTEIFVRDSKHRTGPVLAFGRRDWAAFLASARDGKFDLTP